MTMNKKNLLTIAFYLFSNLIVAQYYYLPNTNNPGNPGNINTDPEYPLGSGMATGWTTILGPSNTTATWSTTQTIPFTFNFNGIPVSQYKVSSSGVLTFDLGNTTAPSYNNSNIPSSAIPDNSIMIWGIEGTGANDNIVTKNFGTAGNQQHWVSFSSYTFGSTWTYWSIVLEEGSNKIYIVDQRTSGNISVTAGLQINSTTAFSVATSPALNSVASTAPDQSDNNYYEFIFGSQPNDNAALTSLNIIPYHVAPANISIQGLVTNLGGNTINAMDITWTDGINSYTDNLTGLNIASNNTYNFTHSNQLSMPNPGSANINVTINMVNNNIDPDTSNNTLDSYVTTLTSIPEKYTVGEEKTGTWCGWCPRGAVALAEMEATPNFIGIAVHNNDPMVVNSYDGDLGTYIPGGYPRGGVDRVVDDNPANFSTMHAARVTDIVPCGVNNIVAFFDANTNNISVSTEIEAFGEMSGSYRLSCVIIEDDLESTASGWAQSNFYSGGGNGVMAFPSNVNGGYDFSTGTDPALPADFGGYDHVARSLSSNNILGDPNSLPSGLINIGTYSYTFADVNINSLAAYSDVGFNWTKAHAVVMIINATTGEILNAKKTALTSNVSSSWDCTNGNCIDPGTGNGTYTSLANCQATCGVTPSWDCVGATCIDPGTGNGIYSSLSACVAVCNTTSVNEFASKLLIYPNPAKDILTIEGAYTAVDIFNILGKLVLSSEYTENINVSSLNNGIYMLKINTEKGIHHKKVTITK